MPEQQAKKPKVPEGADIPDLPDFRNWGKDEGIKPEPEATPPTVDETPGDVAPRELPTKESTALVESKVQKASLVMHHAYVAAVQIVKYETGANDSVVNVDMQPSMPMPLIHQIASPVAKAIFDKIYDEDLEKGIVYAPVPEEPKTK